MKDLTNSPIDRANILHNNVALRELYEQVGFRGIMYDGKFRYTKIQVAAWFEVDERTIERVIEQNFTELNQSGYQIFSGAELNELRQYFADDIHVARKIDPIAELDRLGFSSKTRNLGVFTFKAFLNIGMLLSQSEAAKELRHFMLDIIIDLLNQKTGGSSKYINQRDEDFLPAAIRENHYRKAFTQALDNYIEPGKFKFAQLTDAIYVSIFKENASEYRQILRLGYDDNVRRTLYTEVLDLVSAYENGFAAFLKKYSEETESKLTLADAKILFRQFEEIMEPFISPLREKARNLMASRDMAFRDAFHYRLSEYIKPVSEEDFDRFLGDKSKSLEVRIKDNLDVFLRLKDR